MSLLNELLKWAEKELKPWQSDAVRRLFKQHELSQADYAELLALLKQSKGIPVENAPGLQPLTKESLPKVSTDASVLTLTQLGQFKHVNKLAEEQAIHFAPLGVTVVYGDNGSGKSGFSRVIKSACRARVKGEPVLPDARINVPHQGVPEARFGIRRGDEEMIVAWAEGQPAPRELSEVAILDTRCARAYTDAEGDLIFLPWGLDVVENLARVVLPTLQQRIEAEASQIDVSDAAFLDLKTHTAVGTLLQTLSHRTKQAAVETLATLTPEDVARAETLARALAEKDPADKAKQLRAEAKRVEGIIERIANRYTLVAEPAVQALRLKDEEAEAALAAEKLAAEALRAGEVLLDGTGEAAWKQLFAAAAKFATAHQHHPEPEQKLLESDSCLLCQQPLSAPASARMQRFAEYIKADTAKVATAKVAERKNAMNLLKNSVVAFELEEATLEYLLSKNPELSAAVVTFEHALAKRKAWMLQALGEHSWNAPPVLTGDPRASLSALEKALTGEAVMLEQSLQPGKKDLLLKEKAELDARTLLAGRKQALLDLLERMRAKHRLESCKEDLKTKPISDKAKALASGAVNQKLSEALNEEFEALGVHNLHTKISTRIEQGRPRVKLVLDLPGGARPEHVLSEGEQRAVAIASFLAELKVSGHQGPVVFDDPVSSLDHRRRLHVVRRLAREGQCRQVVVFTHDSVFLVELQRQLKELEVQHAVYHLVYTSARAGLVREGLPWHHQSYNDRLDKLEKHISRLAQTWVNLEPEEAESEMREVYGRFREVSERVVQDVVFEGVIERYNDYIRVPNIRKVVGLEKSPCDKLVEQYGRFGDVIRGHDKASAHQVAPPDPKQAKEELAKLRAVIQELKARHTAQQSN